ncbi:MAG TPA: tetratricopeptide repeat protein [Phycisphaerae bacterium]|nr:tetratricopeptide repeat protein [Phycisphaerae bacterium]
MALSLLLVIITVAAYLPATRCGDIWDDDYYVENNQTLRSFDGLRRIWFELRATPQYYPMVFTSYWLEYRLWGPSPPGYHAVNVLFHALSAVLLWRILVLLDIRGAWLAAALFALHPVNVESVAWITERKNVLSGVFYFGAAQLYLRSAFGPTGRISAGRYATFLALFLCALLSKTVTCTLPAALLLVLWWKRGRLRWSDILAMAPPFVLGIASGLLTAWMEKGHVGAIGQDWNLSFLDRCLIAGRAICFYTLKLLWPHPLAFIYPRWHIDATLWWQFVYPLVVLTAFVALWLARHRLGRGPLVALLFFVGTLFPALGFFNVYPMLFSFVADHFQYLACTGLLTLVVAAAYRLADLRGWSRRPAAAIPAALVLVTLAGVTWHRCSVYVDEEALWRDTLRKNPAAWIAHSNMAPILMSQGKLDEAESHCREALRIRPACREAFYNLGSLRASQGKLDETVDYFRKAAELAPDVAGIQVSLGTALQALGKLDEAIDAYRRALQITPNDAKALNGLGTVLEAQGRPDEALSLYRQAMQANPDSPNPMIRAAWILATHPDARVRQPDEAVRLAQRAADLTRHQNPEVLDILAATCAVAGRFDQAAAAAQAAMELPAASQVPGLMDRLTKRLELYKQRASPRPEPIPPGP